jgi:hypothetical protein
MTTEAKQDPMKATDHPCRACGDANYHWARVEGLREAEGVIRERAGERYARDDDSGAVLLRDCARQLSIKIAEEVGYAEKFERSTAHNHAADV